MWAPQQAHRGLFLHTLNSRCRQGAMNLHAHFADEETEGAEPCQPRARLLSTCHIPVPTGVPGGLPRAGLRAELGLGKS